MFTQQSGQQLGSTALIYADKLIQKAEIAAHFEG
jgi:hypothetical protein